MRKTEKGNVREAGVYNNCVSTMEKAKKEIMEFEKNKKEKPEIPTLLRTERCASGVRFGIKK